MLWVTNEAILGHYEVLSNSRARHNHRGKARSCLALLEDTRLKLFSPISWKRPSRHEPHKFYDQALKCDTT